MKDLIPYLIVLIVAFGAGMLTLHSCQREQTPIVQRDTIHVQGQDLVIRETEYKDRIVYRDKVVPTDDSPCWPLLNQAYRDLDSIAGENWRLSQLEVEGDLSRPDISGTIGWSMPRYLETGQGFAYRLSCVNQTTNTYLPPEQPGFFDRFGYGIQAGGGVSVTPQGTYPSLYVGVGVHFDMKGVF